MEYEYFRRDMTRQELADVVVRNMIKQGRPCRVEDGQCVYVSGELGCAVGRCLTPETRQHVATSHLNKSSLFQVGAKELASWGVPDYETKSILTKRSGSLLYRLQSSHDRAGGDEDEFLYEFLLNAQEVFKDLGLEWSYETPRRPEEV